MGGGVVPDLVEVASIVLVLILAAWASSMSKGMNWQRKIIHLKELQQLERGLTKIISRTSDLSEIELLEEIDDNFNKQNKLSWDSQERQSYVSNHSIKELKSEGKTLLYINLWGGWLLLILKFIAWDTN